MNTHEKRKDKFKVATETVIFVPYLLHTLSHIGVMVRNIIFS